MILYDQNSSLVIHIEHASETKEEGASSYDELEIEILTRVEVIYEDTKAIMGVEPEYKWGEIYRMISNWRVPDAILEDLPIYANIERSKIMNIATRPELFPCLEVIGWILPRIDVTKMILANSEGHGYASYSPAYVAIAYKLPAH